MWEFDDIISGRRVDARAIVTRVKDTPETHSLSWEKCEFSENVQHAIKFNSICAKVPRVDIMLINKILPTYLFFHAEHKKS